ncbi:MAG TPA: cell division protein FtsL [Lachnospiraceae bacterium]|nr:cell division protein FtsL [Lachnospiraceae bacterium]
MAQYRVRETNRRQTAYMGRNSSYIHGNAARKLDEKVYVPDRPKKQLSNTAKKNREKAHHMSLGYVLFLSGAVIAAGFILTAYIGLQADITNSIKNISRLESQLNSLRLDNDEEYSRITNNVDLEEVKRVAIQELGMKYAEEGQIVSITGGGSDYMRQVSDIPK